MAEWTIATDCKSVGRETYEGSNPSPFMSFTCGNSLVVKRKPSKLETQVRILFTAPIEI